MTQNPVVVNQDAEINDVIDIILQKHIILVPVINDQQRLVGVPGWYLLGKQYAVAIFSCPTLHLMAIRR